MVSDARREQMREYQRKRRADARKNGITLACDDWFKRNPDKHRDRVQRWRDKNPERAAELTRSSQKTRRSTPWGKINNRMWAVIHSGVRTKSNFIGKYAEALGYTWNDLREHLESRFDNGMTWDNWGEYWEIDHIKPLSSYRYESVYDESFKECWGLSNLRPLVRWKNQAKGNKTGFSG